MQQEDLDFFKKHLTEQLNELMGRKRSMNPIFTS